MGSFYEAAGQALHSRETRLKCGQVADRIAAAARSLAAAEKVGRHVSITRTDGTRPKGRPYSRVTMDGVDEFGSLEGPRRRILGRAASLSARTGRR